MTGQVCPHCFRLIKINGSVHIRLCAEKKRRLAEWVASTDSAYVN